jgi:D-alanine transaminase
MQPLDNQLLPSIARHVLWDLLAKDGVIKVEELIVTLTKLSDANKYWLTKFRKKIIPVIEVDGESVANKKMGDVWLAAPKLYSAGKSND